MLQTDIIHCPLCASCRIKKIEDISNSTLNKLYAKHFGINDAINQALQYILCNECGLYFFYPMLTGDEKLYEHLQKFDWYYIEDKWEYSQSLNYIQPDNKVLEVGAGRAAFAKYIGPARYTGLEFNQRAIDRANSEGVVLIKESVEQHAAKDNVNLYDVVVSFQVLEHVSDPAGYLKGCISCLKPEGTLIIAVPSMDGFIGKVTNGTLNMPPHHVTHWSCATLKKLEALFNLNLVEIMEEPIAVYHNEWARQVIIESWIRKLLRKKRRLLDLSLSGKVVSKFAAILAKYIPQSMDGIKGHTVVAVYKKSSSH